MSGYRHYVDLWCRPRGGGDTWDDGKAGLILTREVFPETIPSLRPDADDAVGSWTASTGSSLFAMLDEITPDVGDFIQSPVDPVAAIYRARLSNPTPSVDTAQTVTARYTYAKTGTGQVDLVVRLKEGTTTRATWTHTDIGTTPTTVPQYLSAAQASAITDWSNLFLEFQADGFSPAALFAASEEGAWYDPSDLSTLWQDTAGTTAVTADGQAVARIDDKSGNGNHLTQATSGKRPLYKTSGGLHWLEFDGSDDAMVTSAIDFSGSDEMSVFLGLARDTDAVRMVCELSFTTDSNAGSFYFVSGPDNGFYYSALARGSAAAASSQVAGSATPTGADTGVFTMTHDISADLSTFRRNATAGTNGTGDKGTGNFGNHEFYLGARSANSFYFDGKFYGVIIRGKVSSGTEIDGTEAYLATKSGVTL